MSATKRSGSRRTTLPKRLLFSVLPLLLLLLVAELTARVLIEPAGVLAIRDPLSGQVNFDLNEYFRSHDELFWELKPDLRTQPSSWGDVTNSYGFRNVEEPDTTHHRDRVLCLGDSVTYGVGLPIQDTWPSQLARDTRFEVFNAGVPGYTSYQGRVLYNLRCADLEPDIIVVEFGLNDVASWPAVMGDGRVYLTDRERALTVRVHDPWFRLVQWMLSFRLPETDFPQQVTGYAEKPRVSVDEFRENLLSLGRKAPQTVFLTWPLREEFDLSSEKTLPINTYRRYRQAIRSLAADGYIVIDVPEVFRRTGLPPAKLFLDPVHPTPTGAWLVAEEVRDRLGTD
jgi:lysophospholipase L1-like esterase